jgi:hypothetical protein
LGFGEKQETIRRASIGFGKGREEPWSIVIGLSEGEGGTMDNASALLDRRRHDAVDWKFEKTTEAPCLTKLSISERRSREAKDTCCVGVNFSNNPYPRSEMQK